VRRLSIKKEDALMKIKQYKQIGQPGYPTRKQFLNYGTLVGAAAIGLGSIVGGYAEEAVSLPGLPPPPPNMERRLRGQIAVVPPTNAPACTNQTPKVCASANYTVLAGDTLASIAKKLLGDEKKWTEITKLNPDLKADELKAGQVIKVPMMASSPARTNRPIEKAIPLGTPRVIPPKQQ
jgi:nucleoid-associated protein YgaU